MPAPVSETTVLRLERQWDPLFTTQKHFADNRRRANISTGITVEYAVHACEVSGATDDERLVLIMGMRQSMEWWAPLVEQLLSSWSVSGATKNLKILTFDNRGVGGTDAPLMRYTTLLMAEDTVALMDHLGWEEAHIGGISMGGMISMELALLAPTRVKSLSLLATTRGRFMTEAMALFATSRGRLMNEATTDFDAFCSLVWITKEVMISGSLILHSPELLSMKMADKKATIREQMLAYYRDVMEHAKLPTISGAACQASAVVTHFVSNERLVMISNAGFPVLILAGDQDRFIPPQESQKIAEHMKGDHVKHVVIEHGGHGVFVDHLNEVSKEILGTMRKATY